MPIMGATGSPFLFWDGRKDSLWSQALGLLEDAREHGSNRVAIAKLLASQSKVSYERIFGAMPNLRVSTGCGESCRLEQQSETRGRT